MSVELVMGKGWKCAANCTVTENRVSSLKITAIKKMSVQLFLVPLMRDESIQYLRDA